MTYQRFEDTPVWNAAQELGVDVFAVMEDAGFDGRGDLRDQLQRAALSVSNNIAEGFERGTTEDLVWFLYIARGSAGEVRSALLFAQRLLERGLLKPQSSNLKPRIADLLPRCESISRQLRGWADSLQNCAIPGQRHLTDRTREQYHQSRRSQEFLEKLDRIRRGGKPPPADDLKSEI